MRENPLAKFTFNELTEMVKTISNTKWRSSDMRATQGYILETIDDLEANVDLVLGEMVKRVSRQWTFSKIQSNFSRSSVILPHELMNVFNITPSILMKQIRSNPTTVGAEMNNQDEEEIWFAVGAKKYRMTSNGAILIESFNKRF